MIAGIVYGLMIGVFIGCWVGGLSMYRWMGGTDFWGRKKPPVNHSMMIDMNECHICHKQKDEPGELYCSYPHPFDPDDDHGLNFGDYR